MDDIRAVMDVAGSQRAALLGLELTRIGGHHLNAGERRFPGRRPCAAPASPALYPPEFRAEAIRLARSGERTLSEIAEDLGVSQQSLRNWVRQADLDDGRRHDGLTTDDRAEVARLRRENRVLREEREILKRAAAFFAKETRSTP